MYKPIEYYLYDNNVGNLYRYQESNSKSLHLLLIMREGFTIMLEGRALLFTV